VADLPHCLWFADERRLRVARRGTPGPLHVFCDDRLLGELPAPRGEVAVFDLPAGGGPFDVVLRDGRRGPEAARVGFGPGPRLAPRLPRPGVLQWSPGGWLRLELEAFDLSVAGGRLGSAAVSAAAGACRLPAAWCERRADLVLTPVHEDGRRGPSEELLQDPRPARLLSGLRLAGMAALADAPHLLARARSWPGPVLHALCRALQLVAASGVRISRAQAAVCEALGGKANLAELLSAYEQRPGLVHLLLAGPDLAELARRHGLPSDAPVTAAGLVAHAFSRGAGDPELLRYLEDLGAPEVRLWADAVLGGKAGPALRRLRVVRRCPATPDEAAELDAALTRLEEQPADGLADELVPAAAGPTADLLRRAESASHTALQVPTSPQAILDAAAALPPARAALAEHLDGLLRRRPNSPPWPDLRDVLERVEGGRPLAEAAGLLRRLRQNDPGPDQPPAADPPCLLRADAVWLARRDEEQRRQARGVRRVAAWCRAQLSDPRPVALADAPAGDGDGNGDLGAVWKGWLAGWDGVDVRQVFRAVRADPDPAERALRQEMTRAEALLPKGAPAAAPVREVLREMTAERPRLVAWLSQPALRQAARERLADLERGLRGEEARTRGAAALAAALAAVAEPVCRWAGLPALLTELDRLRGWERAAEGAWARLLAKAPDDLRGPLGLAGVDPERDGLDAVAGPVAEHAAEVAAVLDDRAARLRARLERLDALGRVLGLPPAAAPVEAPPPPEAEPAPELGAPAFALLAGLVRRELTRAGLARQADGRLAEIRAAAAAGALRALAPRVGAAVPPPPPGPLAEDARRAADALAALADRGDEAALTDAVARLPRAAALLRERADLLGLSAVPSGAELVRPARSDAWLRDPADAELVRLLRRLAEAPCDAAALLAEPGRLDALDAALAPLRSASQGRPRRWWARVYRDVAEVLRGRLAGLPAVGLGWRPPQVRHRADLVAALDWLRRVEAALGRDDGPPGALRQALRDAELVGPGASGET
jgi:hypothetical protein